MTTEKDDLYNYNTRLKGSLKLIDTSKAIGARDKKYMRRFLDHLAAQRVSTGRLSKCAFLLNSNLERARR
jgi:hypothetical protein